MRNIFDRLGRPDAISWANVIVVVVLQVSGSIISALVDFDGRFALFVLIRIIALAFLALTLGLGKLLLLRFARTKPKPAITLSTFFGALLVGTAVFDILLVTTGFAEEYRFVSRVQIAALGVLTALILTSLLVTYAREFSRSNAELADRAEELVRTRAQATQKISERKQELVAGIRAEINAELTEVTGSDTAQDASRMRKLIDEVVRPISYALARDPNAVEAVDAVIPDSKIAWRVVVRSALAANPFHVLAFPLTIGAIAASFLILTFQLRGLLAVTALMVMSLVIIATGKWLWQFLPEQTATWMRVTLFTLIAIPIAMLSAWLMTILTGFDFLTPVRLTSWVVITLLAHWTVTLVFTVNTLLQQLGVELSATVEELKREVIALNNANRQLKKGVSRVLHGPVQEAIASSLIRLQSQPAAIDDREFVTTIQSRINAALDLLNRPTQSQTNLRALFDDLAEMWSDVVNIQFNASERDLDVLNDHQVTAYSISEIVREGCSNAIRHGDARSIAVHIAVDESRKIVTLRIDNTGRPLNLEAPSGIGSQLFEEVTLSWHRSQVGDQVRLDARVPLSDPDSAQL